MRTDRRGFLRALASALAFAKGAAAGTGDDGDGRDAHRATRNTVWGALVERRPRLGGRPLRYKPYPGQRRVALPALVSGPGLPLAEALSRREPHSGFGDGPVSLARVGRLLHFANGVTGTAEPDRRSGRLRAAPSAGALYAGEVYLVAERIPGLERGAYYYDVPRHQLVLLERGALLGRAAQCLESPAAVAKAAALVLLSNVFARYTWRYADRGYRYALIDSGHIGENLRLATRSAGLAGARFARFHDDGLNDLLALDGREEAVCAVHAFGTPGAATSPPPAAVRRFVQRQHTAGVASPAGRSAIERFHEATKLVPVAGQADSSAAFDPGSAGASASEHAPVLLPLPAPGERPAMSLEEAIGRRRSADRFDSAAMRSGELGFVLEMAWGAPGLEWAKGLDLYWVVHRVEGLAPGLYRGNADRGALVSLHPGPLADRLVRVCLGQRKAGAAAAGCLMVARLGRQGERGRDRSYRDLLLEAGSVGQRLYLAAEAIGLTARNLAAFTDDDLNRLLGLDGRSEAVVHLTMFGPGV